MKLRSIILIFTLSLGCLISYADVEHTIERGETLESIAQLYGVTVESILKANPTAKDMVYAGMILTIPSQGTVSIQDRGNIIIKDRGNNMGNEKPENTYNGMSEKSPEDNSQRVYYGGSEESTPTEESLITTFGSIFLGYSASFKNFEHGYYGVGFQSIWESGLGSEISFWGNWGLGDGSFMMMFGPLYGYTLTDYFALVAPLKGFFYTYSTYNLKGKKDWDINGGIVVTPTLKFHIGKINIGFGYSLGWLNKSKGLYHYAELSLGLHI